MATPSYGHDLVLLDFAEATGNYLQINFEGGGGGTLGAGPDYALQGTNAIDRQVTTNNRGIVLNHPGGAQAAASNGVNHIYIWFTVATAGLVDSIVDTGTYVIAGSTTANNMRFHVDGSETYGAQGRVGRCYVFEYTDAGESLVFPWRSQTGSPPAASTGPTIFGAGSDVTGAAKGANIGLDAQRYGTGAFITSGVLADPATISAFASLSDEIQNRWGITIGIAGGYELQGGMTIGRGASGLDVGVDTFFQEANFSLTVVDLFHCASGFTKVEIDGADTIANFTNMTYQAFPTVVSTAGRLVNPGQFRVVHAGASVGLSGCTFAGIGETVANFDFTAVNTVWRDTGDIVQRSGTFEGCTFTRASGFMNWGSGVLLADDLNRVKNCIFTNDATAPASGCAIRIRANDTGKPVYTVEGCSFTGYGADDTNEAAFHYMGTVPILLSVVDGEAPSVTPTNLVNVSNDVALTVQVNNEAGGGVNLASVIIIDTSDDSTVSQGQTDGTGEFADTLNFGSPIVVEIRVRLLGFLPFVGGGTITGDGLNVTVRFLEDGIVKDG